MLNLKTVATHCLVLNSIENVQQYSSLVWPDHFSIFFVGAEQYIDGKGVWSCKTSDALPCDTVIHRYTSHSLVATNNNVTVDVQSYTK